MISGVVASETERAQTLYISLTIFEALIVMLTNQVESGEG